MCYVHIIHETSNKVNAIHLRERGVPKMKSPAHQPMIHSIQTREQLEEIYDILDQLFPVGRAFFQERLDHDSTYDPATTWAATIDGKIASTIQLFPFHARIEDCSVKIGGIGSVGTLPEYRGQGLSQGILKAQVEWMAEQQYDLSLLFAIITPFYEKAGWNVVPETAYEWTVAPVEAKDAEQYSIEAFDLSDLGAMKTIYEQFNATRTFTVIRPEAFWTDQLSWPRWRSTITLIAKHGGQAVAYGQISSANEGKAYLEELCYLPGHESAVAPLFLELVKNRPEATHIIAKLPADHALLESYRQWGAQQTTMTYSMWKIIRLQPMLAKLSPLFSRRLTSRPELVKDGLYVHLTCEGQHAYLHFGNGTASVYDQPGADVPYTELAIHQKDLVALLFQGVNESTPQELRTDLIEALFPPQHSVFYLTDKF